MHAKTHLGDGVEGVVVEADPRAPPPLVHHSRDRFRGFVPLPRQHALPDEVVETHLVVVPRLPHRLPRGKSMPFRNTAAGLRNIKIQAEETECDHSWMRRPRRKNIRLDLP